jgi:hypothetical protein
MTYLIHQGIDWGIDAFLVCAGPPLPPPTRSACVLQLATPGAWGSPVLLMRRAVHLLMVHPEGLQYTIADGDVKAVWMLLGTLCLAALGLRDHVCGQRRGEHHNGVYARHELRTGSLLTQGQLYWGFQGVT